MVDWAQNTNKLILVDSHENVMTSVWPVFENVMTSVWPAGRVIVRRGKNLNVVTFSDTVKVIKVNLA